MLDDNRDKEMQRNQLLALVLMTGLVFAWLYFFMPEPTKRTTPPPVSQSVQEGERPPWTTEAPGGTPNTPVIPGATTIALPPPAEAPAAPEDDEVILANERLELVFTRVGARLKRATVLLGRDHEDSIQLVPESLMLSDADAVYPLGLLFDDAGLGDAVNYLRWDLAESSERWAARFRLELPGQVRLEKTFTLDANAHTLRVLVSYANLTESVQLLGLDRKEPAFSLYWGPNVSSGDLKKGAGQSIVWRKDGANTYQTTAKLKPVENNWHIQRILDPEWAAICSAYFTVAMKPDYDSADVWYQGTPGMFQLGLGAPRTELAPGGAAEYAFQVYLGPRSGPALAEAWPTLDTVHAFFTSFSIMDRFAKLLLTILVWFHDHAIANYGLAIIFLTLIVRIVMFPLTWKSMLSMKKMSKLAPEMEKIKAECGDDQQEMQKRMMEMYRERGVSPLGGCLPMLLQMPVFIALYRMLWSAVELRRAPFVSWITDLSEPDRLLMLPFKIPLPFSELPLESLNLLPILMAVAMVVSQKLMPMSGPAQNPQQKMLMNIMPVFFSVITYNMASGLNLYILVSTLLGIAQNYLIHGIDVDVDPVKKKKPSKPRHFYDVVRAKQREASKEIRKQKQRPRQRKDTKGRE